METGPILITRGINTRVQQSAAFSKFIMESFARYMRGDWGDTCEEDWKLNDSAVKNGDDRIVAKYDNIFIITEYGRSAATILFTDEY